MFATLIESKAKRQRRTGGALLSVLVHLSLIAGAIAATREVDARPVPPEKPKVIRIDLRPTRPDPEPPKPAHPTSPADPVAGPVTPPLDPLVFKGKIDNVLPPVDTKTYLGNLDSLITSGGRTELTGSGAASGAAHDYAQPFLPNEVEKGIAAVATPAPLYPEMLRAASVEGRVVVRFIVDSTGRVEPGSVEIRESTHDLFARAVRDALPRYRFAPAEAGGRRVRVLVEMPFEFTLKGR